MSWCEANRVDYVFGLARNERLVGAIADELAAAEAASLAQGAPARRFADLAWRTLDSWSRERRVAKAEHLPKGANPRFVVTSLAADQVDARTLYEHLYCARGEIENRMYGRLPRCKRVSSRSGMPGRLLLCILPAEPMPSGLDEIRELAPDYQGELGALRFSRALPTPVRPACHRVEDHPRSPWKSVAGSRVVKASIRPPHDRLRRG
jgi:Transposase DDE domain group 1